MAPRANFLCEKCKEDYELPVGARKCPICAAKLVRLYDQVNVATGLATSNAVDKMTQPYADAKIATESKREDAAKRDRELVDRVEHAMPQVNQQLQQGRMAPISAGQAIGMVDQAGRQASRFASSLLFGRKVQHTKLKD